ncbi:SOS response-associated peptidase [Kouleothrix sp.]|uniref:SOS response-associated peptidase n=1 Tax=Kouleothrix sp. TaxID=2779161 RepID=UPI00391D89BB
MCGRYTLVQAEQVAERFQAAEAQLPLLPRYNVAPSQLMPVVVRNSPNRLVEMQWGLVPAWSKEPRTSFSTINARAETIATSAVFRGPFKSRRCLVPASGFYEWQKLEKGKQPFCIRLRGGDLFAFAGLYDIWRDREGNELYSYTIITTAPNELVAPIHNRMPAILRREDEDAWLSKDSDAARLMGMLEAYPADAMEAYPVSRAVNSPAHDGAELMQPAAA